MMMSKFFHRLDKQTIQVYLCNLQNKVMHINSLPTLSEELPNKRALVNELLTVNWSNLYHMDSVIDQFAHFSHTLSLSMDKHLPLRKTKNYQSDKPWLNEDIKDAISKR